jgi:hypothetical protein
MSDIPATPAAPRPARPNPHGVRFVRAWLFAWLATFILTLGPRLPAGIRRLIARGDDLPDSFLAAFRPDAPTHAACIALGLVGDWCLRGHPNRGMRPTPALRPAHRRRRLARDPPSHHALR